MKIDKGIERKVLPKYPFKKMEVGDSFRIEDGEAGRHRVASASTNFCIKNKKKKFSTGKDKDGVMRCWRVSIFLLAISNCFTL